MKRKTIKIIYWVTTILFALLMLVGGIFDLIQTPDVVESMKPLGYPTYLLTILGVAKILGVLALLQWKWKTLKEWAYAGFTIDIIGASASFWFSGFGVGMTLSPLIVLVVMFVSYASWKKIG